MVRHLIAILVLAVGTQLAAAQDDGAAAIADRLRDLDERLESIIESNSHVLWASIAVAGLAVGATVVYAALLRKQLTLAENDVKHRLLPVLFWDMLDDGSPIRMSGAGERPSGLTIRVANKGQVSAGDIVAHQAARLVGSGASPLPTVRRLGALGPGEFADLHIPMSAEDLGSAMGGGLAYVEVGISYTDGAGKKLEYTVAGYVSGTVSTLFGKRGAASCGVEGAVRATPSAGTAQSRSIQSFGSHARSLVESMGPHDAMAPEDARRVLRECEDAIKNGATSASAHRDMAIALHSLGMHGDALEAIKRAGEADPDDAMALEVKARILVALGMHDEAVGALQRVLDAGGGDLRTHMELARIHTSLGEYGEAHNVWEAIVGMDPGYTSRMGLASVRMVLRQYGPAALALEDAIEKMPDSAPAHAQKGIAQLAHGRPEKAVATLERAIALDGGLADAHLNLAHALHMLGRDGEAARELDLAVGAEPGNQKAHVDRGIRMLETGRPAEARESFGAARRLDPSMLVPEAGA